jgi:HAMP domain-containing protein/DNA-directed RNA polymerase subunit RPC12/RpoP
MQTNCNHCGKQYRIDKSLIKSERAWFSCEGCGERVVVNRLPEAANSGHNTGTSEPTATSKAQTESVKAAASEAASNTGNKLGWFGLRVKMTLLFLVIPLVLMAGASYVYLIELKGLSGLLTNESSQVVTQLAAEIIQGNARSVAKEVRLYLDSHPGLGGADFYNDTGLRKITSQPVGKTGYTVIYELENAKGEWPIWVHPSPKVIGFDTKKLGKPLGEENFAGLWRVVSGTRNGRESSGYYGWREADGSIRQKFMATAIIPHTPYVVASTTYLDEFTRPIQDLKTRASDITDRVTQYAFVALASTLVLVGGIVLIYAMRLTGQIRYLTQHAKRISAGELNSSIEVRSSDEIGELAHAISLMQTSIRVSINRLRRRS